MREQASSHKVMMWSLEFLDRLGVLNVRIDFDSFAFAKDQMGNRYRGHPR
jgi:hypothetical protein